MLFAVDIMKYHTFDDPCSFTIEHQICTWYVLDTFPSNLFELTYLIFTATLFGRYSDFYLT